MTSRWSYLLMVCWLIAQAATMMLLPTRTVIFALFVSLLVTTSVIALGYIMTESNRPFMTLLGMGGGLMAFAGMLRDL